jgi:hypothetical protein
MSPEEWRNRIHTIKVDMQKLPASDQAEAAAALEAIEHALQVIERLEEHDPAEAEKLANLLEEGLRKILSDKVRGIK